MPPFSVGIAQVEERLRTLRRRLNLFALQDGIYLGASMLVVAAALVIALAVRGQATVFALTLWAACAASAVAIAAAAARVRRRWRSMTDVIRFADGRAGLEDRLPTLLLAQTQTSQLKDLLLAQTLAAAPRWDIDVLAPRRMPRSALLLAGSLAGLIVTSYFVRPPAQPMSMAAISPPARLPQPDQARQHPPQPAADVDRPGSGSGHGSSALGAGQAPGNAGADMPIPGGGNAAATSADHTVAAQGTNAAHRGDGAPQARPREADGVNDAKTDADRQQIAAQLQDSIRAAFGAEPVEREPAEHAPKPPPPALSPEHARDGDFTRREMEGSGGRPAQPSSPSQRSDHGADRQPGAAGAAAGAGNQTDQSGAQLFAQHAEAASNGKPSENLPLKLNAFAAAVQNPSDTQPQKAAGLLPLPAAGGRPATKESNEQVPDAPVQKADVAPEHEALLRRIFAHDE